ncbi:MAG: hypothetical protein GY927_23040 [bacterium]|nr:hypothetical protein [bacterium]
MAKKFSTSGLAGSTSKKRRQSKPRQRKSKSTPQEQELIILPAIEATKTTPKASTSYEKAKAAKQSVSPGATCKHHKGFALEETFDKASTSTKRTQKKQQSISQNETPGEAVDYLPEYRSQTNGLRELLSTIDPLDHTYPPHANPQQGPLFDAYHTETAMHIPHSRPGIPVSPDLPIGPTRWGVYFSGALGAVAMLFVSALAFSHFTSPTGIDWTKAQARAGETYSWIVASLSAKPAYQYAERESIAPDVSDPLAGMAGLDETQVATTSRISTTAASPKKGTVNTPTANEIFMTPEELENQIKAFEKRTGRSPKNLFAVRKTAQKSPTTTNARTKAKRAPQPRGFEQLVVIPAANIDPDMESQIFKRASSYLKQRDISSARMILQYAATLGSGISAMALAETFDPSYLKGVNLHDVRGSRADARKWYDMAARLGIKEANARLTDLK